MSTVARLWSVLIFAICVVGIFFLPNYSAARNIHEYRDTISDSAPSANANHTLQFVIRTDVSPGGVFEFTPAAGSEVLGPPDFEVRNVELRVNGTPRDAAAVSAPGVDQVEITPGVPGFIRYTLAPDSGVSSGDRLEFRFGNHTTNSLKPTEIFDIINGTTTVPGDIEPIKNPPTTGTKEVKMEVFDGGLVADAGFLIAIVDRVSMPNVDTTEEIPPFRFNGAPTSTVGGTTQSVEITLETDEFAFCRYSTTPGVDYGSMPNVFTNSGLIFHSVVVAVSPGTFNEFFVRCIDDEGNFNIDDYIIAFAVNEAPTGSANEDGDTEGDGTGTGNQGTGDGSGDGGQSGDSDGQQPATGGSSGTGGSGGGGGGGRGGNSGNTAGGGFENQDAPYRSGDARVVISGFAFPNSTVTVLVDGKVAQTVRANGSGAYSVTLDAISRGVYTFGVYAAGSDSVKSSTFSTSFTVTGARTSELTNINVPPSIRVTPDPVEPGQTLTITGFALPNSTVTLQNSRLNQRNGPETTTQSDGSGRYTTTLSTTGFTRGTYQIRAKAAQDNGAIANYSGYTFYGVGQAADVPLNSDLNRDGRVNLTDFSILLFWWNSNGGDSDPPADISRDGRVTLTDFSILLFNWTG